jgi:hypothetical protein
MTDQQENSDDARSSSAAAESCAAIRAELSMNGFDADKEDHYIMLGGDRSNPGWNEYLQKYEEEYRPYIRGIRECARREGIVGTTGGQMANNHHFAFEDGTRISFSWRAWGDLMQAIVDENEGYMRYYM